MKVATPTMTAILVLGGVSSALLAQEGKTESKTSPQSPPKAPAADAEEDFQKQAARERKELFTKWMQTLAETTTVRLPSTAEDNDRVAKLVPKPVFRYSDEERFIPDATLWVWTRDARPVAFQKVEGNDWGGGKQWTICIASLSEELVTVDWPEHPRFTARTPGVRFLPVSKADVPANTARERTSQMKVLKDRFSGRLGQDPGGKGGAETRTMAKPIFEYADPAGGLPLGAIFGMSSTGTNPDLLLLIEARRDGDGNWRWEYAHARMTSTSVIVRLDDAEVWAEASVPNNRAFDNWAFYFLQRTFR